MRSRIKRTLTKIIVLTMLMCLSGCSSERNYGTIGTTETGNGTNVAMPNQTTAADGRYLIQDDGTDVCDGLTIWGEDAKNFYVMRVKDNYLEIPGECKWISLELTGEYPELEDGQIAYVVADVHLYEGGEEGYMGNIFIQKLISFQVIDDAALLEQFSIPLAGSEEFTYDTRMFQYEKEGDVYLLVMLGQYIEVYKNGAPFMEYEYKELENEFQPFFEKIG